MTIRRSIPAALLALAAASPAMAAPGAPFTIVESGRGFALLQDAVSAIGAGAGTIRIAPGRIAQCAVQQAGNITYIAAVPGQSVFDGVTCESKAALVLRGNSARIEGLVFANQRVPDGNGAGIRLEKGNLAVVQSWFRDSQQGILSGADTSIHIAIDKSTFTRLGTCEGAGGCAHGLYIGDNASLSVTRSRFEAGRGGHYLKARAARVQILGCVFDDTGGHTTNYMIDLSNGATGRIAGNLMIEGADKENHSALIAIAAEGRHNSSAGLEIAGNSARMGPGVKFETVFVADWAGDPIRIGTNALGTNIRRYEKR